MFIRDQLAGLKVKSDRKNRVGATAPRWQHRAVNANDYARIARVIDYLDAHHLEHPDLATLAARADLSPSHFHRLFSAWAGVTPKDFLQCLTLNHAKALLRRGHSVLDAALDAGLSGPGRLHDLCITLEAATPGELKSRGAGLDLRFGVAPTPFGDWLAAESPRGICHLAFVDGDRDGAEAALREEWSGARFRRDDTLARRLAARVFQTAGAASGPLRAYVRGTPFQLRVWRALLEVPPGVLISYGRLAAAAGNPGAARATGSAVGDNPLAFLIPCHRVIRETGVIGEYRWGRTRKQAMIGWETCQSGGRSSSGLAE